MSSDLRSDSWAASVEQTLTRPPAARWPRWPGRCLPLPPRVPPSNRAPPAHVGHSKGSRAEGKAPDRRCRCCRRRMGRPGNPLHARRDDGSSVGCATCGGSRDAGCHAVARLVPITALCAASARRRPGSSSPSGLGAVALELIRGDGSQQLRRCHRRRRVLRSRPDGVPLDVPPVVACAAGPGAVSPRTRHDRDQRRCPRRVDDAALAARARI